ncbi:hypothetical protein ABW20_dc0100158 [Dactylellina cionopaga]|nr:hypothetical protein ABW20_dc0100158 [Dactylellina cionopaga]
MPSKLSLSKIIPRRSGKRQADGVVGRHLPAEIVEQILLDIPAIDVLTTCRQVCKAWKTMVETSSPKLKFYSTTGLRVRKKKDEADKEIADGQPPEITPMALQVLRQFWKKLALQGLAHNAKKDQRHAQRWKSSKKNFVRFAKLVYHVLLERPKFWGVPWSGWLVGVPFYASGLVVKEMAKAIQKHLILPPWLQDIGFLSLRAVSERRLARRVATKLRRQFEPVMKRVPFFTNSGGRSSAYMEVRTNLRYMPELFHATLISKKDWKSIPDVYIEIMFAMTNAVYQYSFNYPRTNEYDYWPVDHPAIGFRFDYADKSFLCGPQKIDPPVWEMLEFGLPRGVNLEQEREESFLLSHCNRGYRAHWLRAAGGTRVAI